MNDALSQESPCDFATAVDDRDLTLLSNSQWVAIVFEDNHRKLICYATNLLGGDREAAIDAVQETFLRLCKQPQQSVAHYVQAWLYRTCRNYIFDQLRHTKKMSISHQTEMLVDRRPDVDPSARMHQDDEIDRCGKEIEKLPESQREVLQLRLTHGMSYKQIAEVTGMTVTNVGVTLHQAVHRLRSALAH